MRFEDMTPEMVERAKGCETAEERTAFIRENGIELTDEQLEGIAGGKKFGESSSSQCPNNKDGHSWVPTGRTRPGKIWGDIWPDYEKRCRHCGEVDWKWRK